MANKPKLDFEPGDTHTFEVVGPAIGKEYQQNPNWSPSYIYDVKAYGREQTLFATKGLQNEIERSIGGARPGDVLVVTRTGKGMETRWDVAYARDDAAPHTQAAPAAARGPARAALPSMTYDDLYDTYTAVYDYAKEKAGDPPASFVEALFLGALLTGATEPGESAASETGSGIEPAAEADNDGKMPPHQWVAQVMQRAGVHPTQHIEVLNHLLDDNLQVSDIREVDQRQAAALYKLTSKGKDLEPVEQAYEELQDFPPDEEVPF